MIEQTDHMECMSRSGLLYVGVIHSAAPQRPALQRLIILTGWPGEDARHQSETSSRGDVARR
jgi:hypothetical protein